VVLKCKTGNGLYGGVLTIHATLTTRARFPSAPLWLVAEAEVVGDDVCFPLEESALLEDIFGV